MTDVDLTDKERWLIDQGHAEPCEACGSVVFNWWDGCRHCGGDGSEQVTLGEAVEP